MAKKTCLTLCSDYTLRAVLLCHFIHILLLTAGCVPKLTRPIII